MKKVKCLMLLIIITVLLTGCKDEDNDIAKEKMEIFLEGYKQQDDTISELLLGNHRSENMMFEGVSQYFANKMEYKIKSCKKEDRGIYKVKVEIQTIDFEKLFLYSYQTTIEKYGTEGIVDNFLNEMEQIILDEKYETINNTCDVLVREVNNELKIQMDGFLANALTGGMNEYLNSLQGEV